MEQEVIIILTQDQRTELERTAKTTMSLFLETILKRLEPDLEAIRDVAYLPLSILVNATKELQTKEPGSLLIPRFYELGNLQVLKFNDLVRNIHL